MQNMRMTRLVKTQDLCGSETPMHLTGGEFMVMLMTFASTF